MPLDPPARRHPTGVGDPVPPPRPRGPWSAWVLDRLRGGTAAPPAAVAGARLDDDDLQLALYCAYETHFSDLPGTVAGMEWDPALIAFRRRLEGCFEQSLREAIGPLPADGPASEVIAAMLAADTGPSLSAHLEQRGTLAQMRDVVVHRSAYQLKEADGHTLGIPRLAGPPKQLLATIQAGEYGADGADRVMHAELFAGTMRALGLDDRLHAYLDVLPGSALAVSNVISMFGLNRRWRGALVGHLAVFEMSSVVPMSRYARALERMGASAAARRFYDVHVLADAEHEVMALELVDAFTAAEPDRRADVLFGAAGALAVEQHFARGLLATWVLTAA